MSAREKLNSAFLKGSLFVAGLIGLVTGSWFVFAVTVIVLVASNLYTGNIRLARRKR